MISDGKWEHIPCHLRHPPSSWMGRYVSVSSYNCISGILLYSWQVQSCCCHLLHCYFPLQLCGWQRHQLHALPWLYESCWGVVESWGCFRESTPSLLGRWVKWETAKERWEVQRACNVVRKGKEGGCTITIREASKKGTPAREWICPLP